MCNSVFENICMNCQQIWSQTAIEIDTQGFKTFSVITYDQSVSSVVLKAKEDRNRLAQKLMAEALTNSILAWKPYVRLSECLLVPIPSTKRAIRKRGGSFLHPILKRVTENLAREGESEIIWREILVHTRKVRDQADLSSVAREKNLDSALRLDLNEAEVTQYSNRPIIVIDDVITTGATLKSAVKALRERKMTVLGASTACTSAHRLLLR